MAKSSEPPSFLLREVLPELADWLRHECKSRRRHDLADQIHDLRIYGRCDCGSDCGTLFCAPPLARAGQMIEFLDLHIWTARGRITEIETFDDTVEEVLQGLFPPVTATSQDDECLE